jgi:hypothetical protein
MKAIKLQREDSICDFLQKSGPPFLAGSDKPLPIGSLVVVPVKDGEVAFKILRHYSRAEYESHHEVQARFDSVAFYEVEPLD